MDIDALSTVVDKYSVIIGNCEFSWFVIWWTLIFMIVSWSAKFIIIISGLGKGRTNKKKRRYKMLVYGASYLIDSLFGFLVSIFLTIIGSAMFNPVISCMIFPITGLIISIVFDLKLISPKVEEIINSNSKNKNKTENSNNQQQLQTTININVGDQNTKNETNTNDLKFKPKKEDYITYITDEDLESDMHNVKFKDAINNLQDNQYKQALILEKESEELSAQSKKLEEQSIMITAINNSMKNDKKFKLKRMIYRCLNQGFVTPDQNEVITSDYNDYRALNGNGEVKELYEQHYLKLPVHNDRRIMQIPVEHDRRSNKQYDNTIYFGDMV